MYLRLGVVVLVCMCLGLSGCMSEMDMPRSELSITTDSLSVVRRSFEETKALVSIWGVSDLNVWDAKFSLRGDVIAMRCTIYRDEVAEQSMPQTGRRQTEDGLVVWKVGASEDADWIPASRFGLEGISDDFSLLGFSPDQSLLALTYDEHVIIWSLQSNSVILREKYGTGEAVHVSADGTRTTTRTDYVLTSSFTEDGRVFQVECGQSRRLAWSIDDGSSRQYQPASEVPETEMSIHVLEGLEPHRFVSRRETLKTSSDKTWCAIRFTGGFYFMGQGDCTKPHVRVWSLRDRRLHLWFHCDSRGFTEPSTVFVPGTSLLLHQDSSRLCLIDVSERQVLDSYPCDEVLAWDLERRQVLCSCRGKVSLVRVLAD